MDTQEKYEGLRIKNNRCSTALDFTKKTTAVLQPKIMNKPVILTESGIQNKHNTQNIIQSSKNKKKENDDLASLMTIKDKQVPPRCNTTLQLDHNEISLKCETRKNSQNGGQFRIRKKNKTNNSTVGRMTSSKINNANSTI